MSNPRISVLTDEFTTKRAQLDSLDKLAADEKRDLSETERADYEANVTRMEAIAADIEETKKRQERFDAVAAVTAAVSGPAYSTPRSPVTITPVPEMGEQIKIRALHSLGKAADEYETLQRTLQHGTSADGTSPVTIEGDLIKFVDANRYAVNAVRRLPMPDNHSSTFKRPRVTQTTSAAIQTNQGDVLASRTLTLTGDTITKKTYGGVLNLSEQEIDWTEPAMLGLAVQDLAEQYAIATDTVLTAAIEASVTSNKTVLSLTAAADAVIAGVASAAQSVYSTSKKLADTLFVSPDRWGYLLGLTDGEGRPLFPIANVFNSAGDNPAGVTGFTGFNILGLKVVVDPNHSSNTWIVAASQLCEVYEQNKGLLTIAAPSTLETQIAYRGYFSANVYAQGTNGFEVA